MNMHVIQTPESALELEQLCRVPLQIISPQNNCPVIGICQDSLVGAYLMTADDVKMTYGQFQQLMMTNSMFIGRMPEPDKSGFFTGKQALSEILLNFDMKYGKHNDPHVIIKDGQLIKGRLDKSHLGAKTNTLTHIIFNDYSPEDCLRFLDNEQQVVNSWLLNQNGFSVGISDCVLGKKDKAEIKDIIEDRLKSAFEILKDANNNVLENKFGKNPAEDFEDQITTHLNKIREATKITDRIDKFHNRFLAMTTSGSKGQDQNLGQIMSCLGQQNVAVKQPDRPTFKQQRIPYNYGKIKGGFDGRTLPHFHRHDDSPKARGFCENSFLFGLDPYEFFFHNSSGREGLIDTAIKSVAADTAIVIIEGGVSKRVLIGDWIDAHLEKRKESVERLPNKDQELLKLDAKTYIPTCDDNGDVTWGEMTAITRHNPGEVMYKITTTGGRSVTVVESKSLIVWQAESRKFKEMQTPDIKLGNLLPVTAELPEPPVTTVSVDMSKYFPPSSYLYSSEFNTARRMHDMMMVGRRQAVRGWWSANNGIAFTLPYNRFQLFARALIRSYSDFKDNCVYPFWGSRECGHIPANFELNHRNGRFVGIYLAEGNSDVSSGYIGITNTSQEVKTFVKAWFDDLGVKHNESTKINHSNGVSNSVRGFSRMLAMFFERFGGKHSYHKFVPDIAFNAPREFVVGLLEGYLTGDGCVIRNAVISSSASSRLTQGIAMLCSRLGVFGKMSTSHAKANNLGTECIAPAYRLTIRAQWAAFLAKQIVLICANKDRQLRDMASTQTHRNFPHHHDVVLDKIVAIEKLDIIDYPKVYDVTVPSTLNFGLANGMMVRDTADTGYLQRRLVKLMEDGKVYYDGTVRNSARLILQFSYGSDGFDSTRLEADSICKRVYLMNDLDLYKNYKLSYGEEWNLYVDAKIRNEISKDVELEGILNGEFEEVYQYRDLIRNEIFKHPMGKSSMNARSADSIESQMPVNVSRLLDTAINKFRARKRLSDLSPRYIVERVTQLMEKITAIEKEPSDYLKQVARDNRLLHRIILRLHLASKKILLHHRLTRDMFDYVIINIEDRFRRSVVHPGDMVGVIAAQSLGQPTTQMTLNTFHQAGQATQFNVVDGVPRLEELISASAKPKAPQITIYLKEQFMQDEDRAEVVRNKLRQTRLSDLARMSEIVYDPSDENTLIGQDQDFLRSYYAFMQEFNCNFDSKWVLRLELDREKLLERNIRMWEIEKALLERYGSEIQCVFADDNAKQLTVRIRVANDPSSDIPDEDQDIIFLLKQLEKSLMDSLVLRGIEGIKNAFLPARESRPFVEKIDSDGGVHDDQNDKEIVIVAEQSGVGENSMLEIFRLPEVDEYRSVSNYIGDIYGVFGIEAARNLLFREIQRVFSSSHINHRHIEMLVDTMTCQGNLTKINRVGIHKLNVGPLARSSFEETETQFTNAAAFAEEDMFRGVSANIMLGQYYPGGTGECEILLDEDMLIEKRNVNSRPETITEDGVMEEDEESEQGQTADIGDGEVSRQPALNLGFDFNLNE